MKYLLSAFLFLPLLAQQQPRPMLPQIRDYLQLTNAQVLLIVANNDDFNRNAVEKQQRIRQVQSEIAGITAGDSLDAADLGVRYQEIELICRDLKQTALTYQKTNLDLLTDAQKAKLKSLEDAWKLMPQILDAQSGNLLNTFVTAPGGFNSSFVINSPGALPNGAGAINGCSGVGLLNVAAKQ